MGPSCLCRILLLCFLLLLVSKNGFGRKLVDMPVNEEHAIAAASEQGKSREMMELDYADAGPNFNGRSGYLFPSFPPPPPPPPPPPSESGY